METLIDELRALNLASAISNFCFNDDSFGLVGVLVFMSSRRRLYDSASNFAALRSSTFFLISGTEVFTKYRICPKERSTAVAEAAGRILVCA
jgi:hypothetical protein